MAESGPATPEPSTVGAGSASRTLLMPILAFFCGGGQALCRVRGLLVQLPVGKFELDAPVAAEHVFADAVLKRLELAVAGRHQAPWRDAAADQVFDDRSRACTGKFPIGRELRAGDGAHADRAS